MIEQLAIALTGVTAIGHVVLPCNAHHKTRAEARLAGGKFYFTGNPCKKGHVSNRRVSNATCVVCEAASAVDWQKNNPGKVKEADKKRWRESKEKRSKSIANAKQKNKEKYRKLKADDWEKNRDRYLALKKHRYQFLMKTDPASIRLAKHKRRARIANAVGTITKGIVGRLLILQKGKCACCGLLLGDGYHMDHIMPLALGGENSDRNIQLLHQRCNNQKHAKHPIDFMQQKGFLL